MANTQNSEQKGFQGDVQFRAISGLPEGAKKINPTPLAYGEKSGHLHVVTGDAELFEFEGKMYAVVGNDGAFLQHVHTSVFNEQYELNALLPKADHRPIALKPNTVIVFGIHKRYNPFAKVFERVLD